MSVEMAFAAALRKELAAIRDRAVETIVSGRAQDFSQYRYSAGYIECLKDVDIVLNQIIEDMQRS